MTRRYFVIPTSRRYGDGDLRGNPGFIPISHSRALRAKTVERSALAQAAAGKTPHTDQESVQSVSQIGSRLHFPTTPRRIGKACEGRRPKAGGLEVLAFGSGPYMAGFLQFCGTALVGALEVRLKQRQFDFEIRTTIQFARGGDAPVVCLDHPLYER